MGKLLTKLPARATRRPAPKAVLKGAVAAVAATKPGREDRAPVSSTPFTRTKSPATRGRMLQEMCPRSCVGAERLIKLIRRHAQEPATKVGRPSWRFKPEQTRSAIAV